jgi:hypothetical protein
MVKARNKFNALVDGYLKTLGNTSEEDIVTFRQRREEATIAALKLKLGKTKDESSVSMELQEEIKYHEEILEKPKGWESFNDYVLADKAAHGKYVRLQKKCGKLEKKLKKLDIIKDHDQRTRLNEKLKKIRLQAERHKWDATGNLKQYVSSQVRPDLLACHGLIWLATAHHSCACSL